MFIGQMPCRSLTTAITRARCTSRSLTTASIFEQRSNNCSYEGPYTSVMLSGQLPSRSLTTAASLLFKASFQPCNTFIASMNTLVSDTPSSLSTEGIRGRSLTTVPCPYGDLTACRSLTTA